MIDFLLSSFLSLSLVLLLVGIAERSEERNKIYG